MFIYHERYFLNMKPLVKITKCSACETISTCHMKAGHYLCAACYIKANQVLEMILAAH